MKNPLSRITRMGNLVVAVEMTPTQVRFIRADGTRGVRQCSLHKWNSWKNPTER